MNTGEIIDVLRKHKPQYIRCDDDLRFSCALDAAIKALNNPERANGRWIGTEYDGFADGAPVYDVWECSNCHGEHFGEFDTLTEYCPHCGAKMEVHDETAG